MRSILFSAHYQLTEKMPILNEDRSIVKPAPLVFQDWGLIDYQQALEKQLQLVQEIADQDLPGYLIFCSHPPVVTTGRATKSDDIFAWQGEVVDVSRGGRATYHGPSQLVVYPLMNLNFPRHDRKEKEIVGFLRVFENSIVKVLKKYDIESVGRSLQKKSDSEADETGVWVRNKKIAALGIAVKRWVTYHGAAINFSKDEKAFKGINPCGFTSDIIITVEDLAPNFPKLADFKSSLAEILLADL